MGMAMSVGVGVGVGMRMCGMEGFAACMLGRSSVEGRVCVLCRGRDEGCL